MDIDKINKCLKKAFSNKLIENELIKSVRIKQCHIRGYSSKQIVAIITSKKQLEYTIKNKIEHMLKVHYGIMIDSHDYRISLNGLLSIEEKIFILFIAAIFLIFLFKIICSIHYNQL